MRRILLPALLALLLPADAGAQTAATFGPWRGGIFTNPAGELQLGVTCLGGVQPSLVLVTNQYMRGGHTGDTVTVRLAVDDSIATTVSWTLEWSQHFATLRAPDSLNHELITRMQQGREVLVTLTPPGAERELRLPVVLGNFRPALWQLACARGIYY